MSFTCAPVPTAGVPMLLPSGSGQIKRSMLLSTTLTEVATKSQNGEIASINVPSNPGFPLQIFSKATWRNLEQNTLVQATTM